MLAPAPSPEARTGAGVAGDAVDRSVGFRERYAVGVAGFEVGFGGLRGRQNDDRRAGELATS